MTGPRPALTCEPRPAGRWRPPPARNSSGRTTSTAQQARPVRTRRGPVPPPWGLRHRPMKHTGVRMSHGLAGTYVAALSRQAMATCAACAQLQSLPHARERSLAGIHAQTRATHARARNLSRMCGRVRRRFQSRMPCDAAGQRQLTRPQIHLRALLRARRRDRCRSCSLARKRFRGRARTDCRSPGRPPAAHAA